MALLDGTDYTRDISLSFIVVFLLFCVLAAFDPKICLATVSESMLNEHNQISRCRIQNKFEYSLRNLPCKPQITVNFRGLCP